MLMIKPLHPFFDLKIMKLIGYKRKEKKKKMFICRECEKFLKKGDQIVKAASYVILDNEEDTNPDFEIFHVYHKSCYEKLLSKRR